jgi:hypothetical protein
MDPTNSAASSPLQIFFPRSAIFVVFFALDVIYKALLSIVELGDV